MRFYVGGWGAVSRCGVAVNVGRCCRGLSPPGWSPRASSAGEKGLWLGMRGGRRAGGQAFPPAPSRARGHLLPVQGVWDPRGLQLRRQEQLQPDGGARGPLALNEERNLLRLRDRGRGRAVAEP